MADYRARLSRLEEAIAPTAPQPRFVFLNNGQTEREAIDAEIAKLRLTPAEVQASHWVCVCWGR